MPNTWTPPIAWDVTKAISAARLNQFIGDDGVNPGNLKYLFARPQSFGSAVNSAVTTSSTTFVDMDNTNLNPTITPQGVKLLIIFHSSTDVTNADMYAVDLLVGGTSVSGGVGVARSCGTPSAATPIAASFVWVATVTAGSPVALKIQWKDTNVLSSSSSKYRQLAVVEIG